MIDDKKINNVKQYFHNTLSKFGTTSKGVDWNTEETREARFDQILKVADPIHPFSILDYGCGYGALIEYLRKKPFLINQYIGYDILESMIDAARGIYGHLNWAQFTTSIMEAPIADYAVACGVFNMKLDAGFDEWTEFVITGLKEMDAHSRHGFSSNFLTKYSDADRMRPDLYYADPCFLFDYCKTHFSKDVAILHDYGMYDFTLIVRK